MALDDVWAVDSEASIRTRCVIQAFRDAHRAHEDELGDESEVAFSAIAFAEALNDLDAEASTATAGAGDAATAASTSKPRAVTFATREACVSAISDLLPSVSAGTAATEALVDALVAAKTVRITEELIEGEDEIATTLTGDELLSNGVSVGAKCLAVLSEDDDWHEAVVKEVVAPTLDDAEPAYEVVFTQWGKPQRVTRSQLVLLEEAADYEDEDGGDGVCGMCKREAPLTRHHLIPRETHTKYRKKGLTTEFLNTCALICRPCHSAVHRFAPNSVLAAKYNTLELLNAQPALAKWAAFAHTQPIVERGFGLRNRK